MDNRQNLIIFIKKCYKDAEYSPKDYIIPIRNQAFGALQYYFFNYGYDDALTEWWNGSENYFGMVDKFNDLLRR